MRLAVSNLAWDVTEDVEIAKLLSNFDIDAIEIAPGKYFPQPNMATADEIRSIRKWWSERGIEITGMQALLFGTTGLNLFASSAIQNEMLQHLTAVCRIGEGLGAKRLVFGSPKNRDCTGLTGEVALNIASTFFGQFGDIAKKHGLIVCIEPTPHRYGANFMTNSAETAQLVGHVNHPAILMQFDTGALTINGEDPEAVLSCYAPLIGHVHASEPDLVPLGDGGAEHTNINSAMKRHLSNHLVCVEMMATKKEPHACSVNRALNVAIQYYRKNELGTPR